MLKVVKDKRAHRCIVLLLGCQQECIVMKGMYSSLIFLGTDSMERMICHDLFSHEWSQNGFEVAKVTINNKYHTAS